MPRGLILAVFCISSLHAALWPAHLGSYQRTSATPLDIDKDQRAQAEEYGLQEAESASYGSFQVKAERYKDPTGAYAASLEVPNRLKTRIGNYLLSCDGKCPLDLSTLAEAGLPHVSHASVPTLGSYLPDRNRIPRSERYILGPAGLQANTPEIPASAAAFDFGTEAEIARYRVPRATVTMGIFSYPTPALARQQVPKFEVITGATVKRSDALIAVVLAPAAIDRAAAEKLLSGVNYNGAVSINETPPLVVEPQTAAQILVAVFDLAGLVLAFCLFSGLLVAGILFAARRFGYSGADGTLTTLHLGRK